MASRTTKTEHRFPIVKKRFGQHFLERAWADKLVRQMAPAAADVFLEIGAGRGALTEPLSRAVRHVTAVEIDRELAALLRAMALPNVTVVEADFLEATGEQLLAALPSAAASVSSRAVRVAGNLPYNVASPILFRLIEHYRRAFPMTDATVMLQREVAERLLAPPGTRDYGVLTVLVRHAAEVSRVLLLPPGAFRPAPEVDSAVVRLTFHPDRPPARDQPAFQALVRSVFTRRRKTLANALGAYRNTARETIDRALAAAGIDGVRRPETLEIAEFVRLSDALSVEG